MALVVLYEAGLQATYEDISDRFRNYTLDVTQNAEEGAVALSTVTIDDPDGNYEIKGWRRLAIYENAASAGSNSLLYNGFIVNRKIIRGPYRTGAGRQWVCSVADTNCLAEFRIMVGSDANRPAETDVARMQWLMSTSEMNRIPNTTFLDTSEAVAMDAVDYRGQRAVDVLNDCAQASGKNYFIFAIDAPAAPLPAAPGATHLWYDFADSTARTSSIRLSNVASDVSGDPYGLTYFIADDTELERDPSRVYSGAYLQYDGGAAYEEDLTISNEFTRRDAVVPAYNIKTNAKATSRALRYLSEMASEEDRIRTAIRLPAARVNFVREGMRVQFKATHLPGYESFGWQRVLRRTIKQDSEEEYLVTLELSTSPVAPSIVQYKYTTDILSSRVTLDAAPTPGNTLIMFVARRDSGEPDNPLLGGWTTIAKVSNNAASFRAGAMFYRVATANEAPYTYLGDGRTYIPGDAGERVGIVEITGSYAGIFAERNTVPATTALNCGGAVTPTAPCIIFGLGEVGHGDSEFDAPGSHVAPNANVTELDEQWTNAVSPLYWVGYRTIAHPSGSYTIGGTVDISATFCGITAVFE